MSDPFVRAQGRGCLASLGVFALSVALVVAALALSLGAAASAGVDPNARLMIFALAFVLCMGAIAAASLAFAARRTRALDGAFAALGLEARGAILNVREFHGAVGGRPVDALYARRGSTLDLHVATRLHTTLAVGTRTGLGQKVRELAGMSEVSMAHDPAFAQLIVSADDPAWAVRCLADATVRAAVLGCVSDPSQRELRIFALRPGAVRLSRRYAPVESLARDLASMVSTLAAVATRIEQLPPPSRAVPLSPLEARARSAPSALAFRLVAVIIGVTLLLAVAGAAASIALSQRAGGASASPSSPTQELPARSGRRRRF